jgi:hypothetical protein
MKATNHYRLDGDHPSIVATGHTVIDLGVAKQLSHSVELDFSIDNLTNRDLLGDAELFRVAGHARRARGR